MSGCGIACMGDGRRRRGIYDNMKTAVDTVFLGKDRRFNRRFTQMCGHYLVEPVACTPAAGWEEGQVENQVGLGRYRNPSQKR
jgi:transposase